MGVCVQYFFKYVHVARACYHGCVYTVFISLNLYLQQEHVITELKEYATGSPTPLDASTVAMVVGYLEACNRMFEQGRLGHVRILTYPNQILDNMEGYSFFSQWLDSLLENG